jgi:hypothetical protein
MSLRSIVVTAVVGAGCVVFGAGPALAGEVTGNGKPLWTNTTDWTVEPHFLHGNSICAFSGQEDTQFPASPDYDPNSGHAQSWGQIPKAVRDSFPAEMHPGIACNGHLNSQHALAP